MATVAVNGAATARDQELVLRFFRVALDVRRATEAALIAHGLTGPQFGALLHLRLVGAISMRDLAESLGCDASNLTGIADRLERRGLMVRRVDSQDRRIKNLVLTDEGFRVAEAVWAAAASTTAIVNLPAAVKDTLLRELPKLGPVTRAECGGLQNTGA